MGGTVAHDDNPRTSIKGGAMAWYLNLALTGFRNAVNIKFPARDKTSDGTIGDEAHAQRQSDHNPDLDGSVDAWDMDVDLRTPNTAAEIEHLKSVFERHESSGYWIHNRQIASRSNNWVRQTYTGTNPHDMHVHWNTRGSFENSTAPWVLDEGGGVATLFQFTGGYWYSQGGLRKSVPDGNTYKKLRGLPGVISYPGVDSNGFAAPSLESLGWSVAQVDLAFGTTDLEVEVTFTFTPDDLDAIEAAARAGAEAGAEAGAPTHDELVAAAAEGAELAEDK